MIPFPALLGLILGLGLGVIMALRRKGRWMDIVHHAAVLGLIGLTLGYFAMLVLPAPQ